MTLTLGNGQLDLDTLAELHGRPIRVDISDAARERVASARAEVERHLASGDVIYGVNTGFGRLCNKRIGTADLARLQENLLVSHAVGVGEPIPDQIVRLMLLLKINALLVGASGIQPACIDALAAMLNADVLPVIPRRGSLGASGDLAPLAHLVLPLIGRGQVRVNHQTVAAEKAFEEAGIARISLGAKDGLALINGTQMMLAYAADVAIRARQLAKHADIIASISIEAAKGSLSPFGVELMQLRPHRGACETSENVRRLMADSEILASHANCTKVQDPYCLRCVPAVHGACRDALRHMCEVVEVELNSVTDNPVILGDKVVSGGLFHGESLALTLDYIAMALTEWANISERRLYMLLFGDEELPALLLRDTGLNSGFMIVQYTAAALVNACKTACMPASVDSIPSSLGQEDHVSMGATSAVKCHEVMDQVEMVLAIEMLGACQALDFRLPLKPGIGPRIAHATLRREIAFADADRAFGEDINKAIEILRRGDVLKAVEAEIGPLA
ncbi:MAG: histidine ammonia-lyase [Phycisphaerales bacterium]|nr:histidine ammonia-lyase [Phycisphaerales bacterium]MCB9863691.1 histidine ammonia-lyase [Phycisphaerales bacterium]